MEHGRYSPRRSRPNHAKSPRDKDKLCRTTAHPSTVLRAMNVAGVMQWCERFSSYKSKHRSRELLEKHPDLIEQGKALIDDMHAQLTVLNHMLPTITAHERRGYAVPDQYRHSISKVCIMLHSLAPVLVCYNVVAWVRSLPCGRSRTAPKISASEISLVGIRPLRVWIMNTGFVPRRRLQ